MITYMYDELFYHFEEKEYDVLVHGCNCFCEMSSGFARHVRLLYPNICEIDANTPKGDIAKLGTISYGTTEHGVIVNMYTQFKGGENFDIDAFTKSMQLVSDNFTNKKIVMPKVGCGIGGGTWEEIEKVLNEKFNHLDITVHDFLPRNYSLY